MRTNCEKGRHEFHDMYDEECVEVLDSYTTTVIKKTYLGASCHICGLFIKRPE